jgi:hypothetical protein
MYSKNQTEPILIIIQQGLQRCGNYSAEGDCYNREHIIPQSTLGLRLHGFRCSLSPQRTVKWTDKDQVTHMEQGTTTWIKRKQIRF